MNGFNGRSFDSLLDGKFHHFALVVDLDRQQVSLAIDGKVEEGWTHPLPPASTTTNLHHHVSLPAIAGGTFSWPYNGEGFRGDFDEVAFTPSALPLTLIAQHAAAAAVGQHYSFTDLCQAPPAVPPSTDLRVVPWDYAPTVSGNQTSFLSVQSPAYQAWNSGALAPAASYTFVPRSSWNAAGSTATWYLWVRARNLGSKAAPVYASVDGGAALKLGCVTGRDWTWVRTDLATGLPAAFTGLAADVAHTLRVAPGSSDVQLDLVKLAPEVDHMECPVAATCGCAP